MNSESAAAPEGNMNTGITVGSGVPGNPLNLAQLPGRSPFCLSLLMPAFKTSAVPMPNQQAGATQPGGPS